MQNRNSMKLFAFDKILQCPKIIQEMGCSFFTPNFFTPIFVLHEFFAFFTPIFSKNFFSKLKKKQKFWCKTISPKKWYHGKKFSKINKMVFWNLRLRYNNLISIRTRNFQMKINHEIKF